MVYSINKKDYEVTGDLSKISLGHFIDYMKELDGEQPELLQELLEKQAEENIPFWEFTTNQQQASILPFCMKKIVHFSNIPLSLLEEGTPKQVFQIFLQLEYEISLFKYNQDFNQFAIGKYKFTLPQRLMTDATVIEFIDAAEFQRQAEDLKNGNWESLPNVMCILCKREGERKIEHTKLLDKLHKMPKSKPLKRPDFFRQFCTVDIALNVLFFLMNLSKKFLKRSTLSLNIMATAKAIALQKRNMNTNLVGIKH